MKRTWNGIFYIYSSSNSDIWLLSLVSLSLLRAFIPSPFSEVTMGFKIELTSSNTCAILKTSARSY